MTRECPDQNNQGDRKGSESRSFKIFRTSQSGLLSL